MRDENPLCNSNELWLKVCRLKIEEIIMRRNRINHSIQTDRHTHRRHRKRTLRSMWTHLKACRRCRYERISSRRLLFVMMKFVIIDANFFQRVLQHHHRRESKCWQENKSSFCDSKEEIWICRGDMIISLSGMLLKGRQKFTKW